VVQGLLIGIGGAAVIAAILHNGWFTRRRRKPAIDSRPRADEFEYDTVPAEGDHKTAPELGDHTTDAEPGDNHKGAT
jgi:FtsZ-interacting cell division protein ZipA